jgi:ADP-dependent NAD(P)H-hydrate dehydratase / NAD(P)H-hydrate epimerase
MALPTAIFSTQQVRDLDDHAIERLGIPGYTLMKRAGEAALRIMRTRWPMAHDIAIVCGGGNNGGDGYVMARFAHAAGLNVRVLALVPVEKLHGDALRACNDLLTSAGEQVLEAFDSTMADASTLDGALAGCDLIVDAVLGTGLKGAVRDDAERVLQAINAARKPVFALDIPSGLCSDSGRVLGEAVRADATISFVGLKSGLFLGAGPEHCGQLFFDDLEITPPDRPQFAPRLTRILESEIAQALPRRPRAAHKGSFGEVLVIGGGVGMAGAARLAGEAALRVGAGLVTVATAPESVLAVVGGRPELMVHGVADAAALQPLLDRTDIVAIGPGLGRSDWARALLAAALDWPGPLIVDADALNLVAEQRGPARRNWILTPHPGEAARLLGPAISNADVQTDRLGALEQLVARFGGVCVLKGAGTLIGTAGQPPGICERGNPGMAAPGMGDVLTGTIAGLLAQTNDPWVAARLGVLVHAMAGDAEARQGERGMLAGEVARELRTWVNLQ